MHRQITLVLFDLHSSGDDPEPEKEGGHIGCKAHAVRSVINRLTTALTGLAMTNCPVGRPEVLKKDRKLPIWQAEHLAGEPLLIRTLSEYPELAQPAVDAGGVPAVAVAAEVQLLPAADRLLRIDDGAEF